MLQVTCSSFLSAARVRNERGLDRVQSLQCMSELVSVCSQTGSYHVPHLLSVVASILVQGPRLVFMFNALFLSVYLFPFVGVAGLGPVCRKSRNFSDPFRVT